MPNYRLQDGNVIVADADFIAQYHPTATLIPDTPTPVSKVITKLEYMNRFTDAELAAIYTAAKTAVQIEIWLDKFKMASEIDLNDPQTATGLQALITAGLLAVGRDVQILA